MKANFSQFKTVYVIGKEGNVFSHMALNSKTGNVLIVRPEQVFDTEIKGCIEGSCNLVFDVMEGVDIPASEFWIIYTNVAKGFLAQIK